MKILITGGAGYIGNILVNKIFAARSNYESKKREQDSACPVCKSDWHDRLSHTISEDIELTVYDNLQYRQVCLTEHCYRSSFNFIHGDVRDQSKLLKYVKQADVIIPLAAIVGFPACEKDPKIAKEVNYEQIKFIIANTSINQRIISPSSNSGYGLGQGILECTEETPLDPITVYGQTKCDAEKLLLDSGRAITLRLATVFGISPRMRLDLLVNDFVYRAVNDGYIVLFEKDFKRNFIHIQDVALTFIFIMNVYEDYVGNSFNVGLSSANLSKLELCEKIKEQLPSFVIKYDDFREDPDKRNYIVSNAKLEATGWKPYYSIEDGIRELIKAYTIISYGNRRFTNL